MISSPSSSLSTLTPAPSDAETTTPLIPARYLPLAQPWTRPAHSSARPSAHAPYAARRGSGKAASPMYRLLERQTHAADDERATGGRVMPSAALSRAAAPSVRPALSQDMASSHRLARVRHNPVRDADMEYLIFSPVVPRPSPLRPGDARQLVGALLDAVERQAVGDATQWAHAVRGSFTRTARVHVSLCTAARFRTFDMPALLLSRVLQSLSVHGVVGHALEITHDAETAAPPQPAPEPAGAPVDLEYVAPAVRWSLAYVPGGTSIGTLNGRRRRYTDFPATLRARATPTPAGPRIAELGLAVLRVGGGSGGGGGEGDGEGEGWAGEFGIPDAVVRDLEMAERMGRMLPVLERMKGGAGPSDARTAVEELLGVGREEALREVGDAEHEGRGDGDGGDGRKGEQGRVNGEGEGEVDTAGADDGRIGDEE
ncbi:hypothetical protein Q5752_003821 [Cryptotrichosporon argae]